MIKLPITSDEWEVDIKRYVSSVNHSLEYANVESSLVRTAVDIRSLLTEEVYNKICDNAISEDPDVAHSIKDLLIRSMLHLTLYHHTIYLIANIGNEGITVHKGDDSTAIYKYQQDALEYRLVSDGWFWFNRLLFELAERDLYVPEQTSELSLQDFTQYVGISDNHYYIAVRWIIKEVWEQEVQSRICSHKETAEDSARILALLRRACCYEVVARSIERLSFFYLPDTLRKDLKNEHANKVTTPEDLKNKIVAVYHSQAEVYFASIDTELRSSTDMCSEHVATQPFQPTTITESDSFCL